jgi:hypothetical protein
MSKKKRGARGVRRGNIRARKMRMRNAGKASTQCRAKNSSARRKIANLKQVCDFFWIAAHLTGQIKKIKKIVFPEVVSRIFFKFRYALRLWFFSTSTGNLQKKGCAILKLPANNATTSKTRPTLKWNAANCADTYNVTIKDAATGKKVDSATGLTVLQYRTKTLSKGKTYKWFVQACNTHGCAKSTTWKLTVQ